MLTHSDKKILLKEFPNIKLSYENISHNKVYNSDIVIAIPEGKKCFSWFTNFNNADICIILFLNENRQIYDIKIVNCCFNTQLCLNTIFYGTMFNYKYNNYITIEDIHFYKNENVSNLNWFQKLELLKRIMIEDIRQLSYNKHFVVFGLPLFFNNFYELYNNIDSIKYKIHSAKFMYYNNVKKSFILLFNEFSNINNKSHDFNIINNLTNNYRNNYHNKNNNYNNYDFNNKINNKNNENVKNNNINKLNNLNKEINNNFKKNIIFNIKPDIQNDIYNLYCYDDINNAFVYYDVAYIPTYNTSVMMNKLFRNIKENINLDKLEESDDEEEFENEREDKFVYLDKSYNMLCNYNYKFKKFVPIKLASDNEKIIIQKDLLSFEKNKR
jgi:hypothetical protein